MRERPLSPHLTIYRMSRYSLLSSFANRVTGLLLSGSLILLVYWLTAAASGELAYARASAVLASLWLKIVYAVLLIAFVYHFLAGIRHLVWDTGSGLERSQSQHSAWMLFAATAAVALVIAVWALLHGSRS